MLLVIEGFGWLWSIFSSFWFWLDSTILSFISTLYNFLITLSRTSILSQAQIQNFATRIQMLLGIFMLFKVSFSLIMYVVNPDDFSDKSKGVGKLAQNTIVSLILLAVVTFLFNMAYRLQSLVLEDNTLARIILGTDNDQNGDNKDSASVLLEAGDLMSYYVMIPFFQPNTGIYNQEKDYGLENCVNLMSGGSFNDSCYKALIEAVSEDDKVHIDNYKKGVESESVGLTFRLATVNVRLEDNTDEYLFNYRWPLTTVVGVIVCLLLINFCIDIAVRSVKLAFFQLIAPIPIISYMDPKSGKDGLFMKWAKMCGSTFISLFVRLVALYFGIYIISQIHTLYDVTNGSIISNPFAILFIVIGVLFFVKQLPKILESLGIKLDGDGKFNLNPFKKIGEGAVGMQKPMENLHKNGYGIGLGSKKILSGIDSARHGKGFFNGVRKIEGAGALSRAKKWYRDVTPSRTEELNKSREAKAALNYKKRLYDEGDKRLKQRSTIDPNKTINENIKEKKGNLASDFVDASGNAVMAVDKTNLEIHYEELAKALLEQYGKDNAKNREYVRIAVEKQKAEHEVRRLDAIKRKAYDPNTGDFDVGRILGAKDIGGSDLKSVEALESAIETQRKALESVSEYQTQEKDFRYKNGVIDSAISTSKGIEPRRNDLKP